MTAADYMTPKAREMERIAKRMVRRERQLYRYLSGKWYRGSWVPVLRRVARQIEDDCLNDGYRHVYGAAKKTLENWEKVGENDGRETST